MSARAVRPAASGYHAGVSSDPPPSSVADTLTLSPRSVIDGRELETAVTAPGDDEVEQSAPRPSTPSLPDRYADIRQLGSGGFAEVRLVFDRKLERPVAMKILRPDVDRGPMRARFLAEIKLTAVLHHPGIVAVHDFGELPDGRLWFTMAEVRGRTLRAVIEQAFASSGAHAGRRRLLDVFARVCEAVAFAHSRGVIHRDLKPDNIMVGDFGRVLVMDWGIARRIGAQPDGADGPPVPDSGERRAEGLTEHGAVLGTPAYMPPEQARGDVGKLGPTADVYALGAILYHVLSGRPPYSGAAMEALFAVLSGPPPRLGPAEAPADLIAICERAMARDPRDRHADAGELAAAITSFLDGAQRRERALVALGKAMSIAPEIARLRERAEALRAEGKQLLDPLRPFDPVDAKLPGWEREDEAEQVEREAALRETRWSQEVHGALAIDPDLPEAHAALADYYREKLVEAERAHRNADATRFEVLLRAHDRGRHAAFLSGNGALTLMTDPPGASVSLHRYVPFQRRLVPELVGEIGPTPIVDLALPHGSYLLRISAPARIPVAYPVLIERGERWDGRPPGGEDPHPIPLPAIGELDDDEVYVPAGWAWTGGDPEAPDSLPRRLMWIDGFVVGRFPVTNEQYLAFLNDLVASGREAEALAACPRPNRGTVEGADEQLSYDRCPDGRFRLKVRDLAEMWTPHGPAVLMSWHAAMAYARWLAARTGRAYRLIHEMEREKAVRGVDGRVYPWGDNFDPTWACMASSHAGGTARVDVHAYPLDESPYGMRGGAGNTRDYCVNLWTSRGPELRDGRLVIDVAPTGSEDYRAVRGGAWSSVENHCRAAGRFVVHPDKGRSTLGLRVARPYP
jgi:serine/threonine-protein kinase